MRCPKCGYISFDHMDNCLKCKKDIKEVSTNLHGTVFHVAAPAFLKISSRRDEKPDNEEDFAEKFDTHDDFVDEDLEVLVDDDRDNEVSGKDEKSVVDSVDSADSEIEMDLSQFEDTEEFDEAAEEPQKSQEKHEEPHLALDLPAELTDISDLAPPRRDSKDDKAELQSFAKKDVSDLKLDDLNFDLGLGDLGVNSAIGSNPAEETILALDDIDFSETLTTTKSAPKSATKQAGADMDEDLNFDLDLGGLSIRKDL
jgi:hypothetical protein